MVTAEAEVEPKVPGEAIINQLPDDMVEAIEAIKSNPNLAGQFSLKRTDRSKVHWAGQPLPDRVTIYRADGTPQKVHTARVGYYLSKPAFYARPPVERPMGKLACRYPGCRRNDLQYGFQTEAQRDAHESKKHQSWYLNREKDETREWQRQQYELMSTAINRLVAATGGDSVEEATVDVTPKPTRRTRPAVTCPECGKQVKNLALHRRWKHGGS